MVGLRSVGLDDCVGGGWRDGASKRRPCEVRGIRVGLVKAIVVVVVVSRAGGSSEQVV